MTATATRTARWTIKEKQDLINRLEAAKGQGRTKGSVYEEIANERGVKAGAIHQQATAIKRAGSTQAIGAKPAFSLRSVVLSALSNDDLLKLREMMVEEGKTRSDTSSIEAAEKEQIAAIKAQAKADKDVAKSLASLF